MIVIGLTGGIGMGKSTVAKILAGLGYPLHSADAAVHTLLGKQGKAVKKVARIFPEALRNDMIDRAVLGNMVFRHPGKLRALEKILHPLVQQSEKAFLRDAKRQQHPAAILEIPLLFETGAEKRCDIVVTVTAPRAVQQQRVMKRKGMTRSRFNAIVKAQMPDSERRQRADYVIATDVAYAVTRKALKDMMKLLIA